MVTQLGRRLTVKADVLSSSCASVLHRSGGFFSKILKKRPHKEAQTPDNGELTLAQILSERPTAGEGKQH